MNELEIFVEMRRRVRALLKLYIQQDDKSAHMHFHFVQQQQHKLGDSGMSEHATRPIITNIADLSVQTFQPTTSIFDM